MISKLNETLEVTNGVIEFTSEIVERLEDYLEKYCLEILKTLNLLVKVDNQDWFLIPSKETIKKLLIHTTETCSVEEIKDSINETISNLVRKGYHEFSNLLYQIEKAGSGTLHRRFGPFGVRTTSGYLVRAFSPHPNRLRRLQISAGRCA